MYPMLGNDLGSGMPKLFSIHHAVRFTPLANLRFVMSWKPSAGSSVTGNEYKTRSGLVLAALSTTTGSRRRPYCAPLSTKSPIVLGVRGGNCDYVRLGGLADVLWGPLAARVVVADRFVLSEMLILPYGHRSSIYTLHPHMHIYKLLYAGDESCITSASFPFRDASN